jgi:predicted HicB family RNase H-like nuclease
MPAAEPPPGRTYGGKFVVRLSPDLHRRAALQAMARGESLNQIVIEALAHA